MKAKIAELTKNFQKFFQKTGTKRAIVGISGGVDSACSLSICVRAIGAENVIGLLMPHKDFSSIENLQDAENLAKSMQIEYHKIEISNFTQAFFDLNFAQKDFTRANIMARVRMILLYAMANEKNGLVIGTCNKTEILTGYFTKYGDGGADVEILGSLWKTEVFQLAKELGLPEIFYTKKPSAELFKNHYDEDEIGVQYQEIDKILQKIEFNKNFQAQTDAEKKIFSLYQNSAHKRTLPFVI